MTESKKRVALKATPLLMVFFLMLFASARRVDATVIKNLRFGDNKGYVRMVLESDRPLNPTPSVSIDRNTLQITLTGIINNLSNPKIGKSNNDIISLDVSRKSDAMRIDAVFSFAPADIKTFSLTGPHRFIIDAYRPFPQATTEPPIEIERPVTATQKTVSPPEPGREKEKPHSAGVSPSFDEAFVKAGASASPRNDSVEDLRQKRSQQRLIAALIVVTSIIAVLLVLLIWMGDNPKEPSKSSWIKDLPPTTDRDIESIDSVIGKHLNDLDHR